MSPAIAGDGQFSERFRREAEVVMRLKHPHIVPVESFGEHNGFVYLVMPLLKVGSLADRLQKGALSPDEGACIMGQISEALQFAHEQGVVHRDVKPSNILLDEHGNALLSDFGLAKIHDASVSLTGSALLGTPAYISPEQARGGPVDARSDQYSLGVILYQLSTGDLPFEADTPMAVLMKHINEPLPPPRMRRPGVPDAVERVILKATAKLPEERFASVAEFNQAFQAALAHARDPRAFPKPKIQVPPSSVSIHASQASLAQPQRGWRARRWALALGLLLLLLLACPSTGLRALFQRSASPAEGSAPLMEGMNDPQLTALAGTIEAMSTELAASGGGTLSAEDIPTMVMETLVADSTLEAPTPTPAEGTTLEPLALTGPSNTATPGPSPTPSRTPTKTRTPTPGPSPTPSRTPTKTLTPTPGPSPTPSATPTKTATSTLGPSPTPTKTHSPSPTVGLSPSPTATTMVAPTATLPGAAATMPLPTPTKDVCSQIYLGDFAIDADSWDQLEIKVVNDSPVDVTIKAMHFDWPLVPPTQELEKIEQDDDRIWDNGDSNPPTNIPGTIDGNWKGPSDWRRVRAESSDKLEFYFREDAEPGGYGLHLLFDNGCTVNR